MSGSRTSYSSINDDKGNAPSFFSSFLALFSPSNNNANNGTSNEQRETQQKKTDNIFSSDSTGEKKSLLGAGSNTQKPGGSLK